MKKKTEIAEPVTIPYDYISNSDSIDGMKALPDNCVDLIIADVPYNLSKSGNWKWDNSVSLAGMGGNWNITNENWDSMSLEDYFNFSIAWLSQAKRILKPTGSMWIFGTYHNIGIINVVCQMLGIEIINEVIWYKKNAFPNLSGRRLTASQREELKYGKHPTQKPIKVLTRMIKLSSKPGDIMLTPFSGAGSECVAAKLTGRHYIGFEIEKKYCDISEERLSHTVTKEEKNSDKTGD